MTWNRREWLTAATAAGGLAHRLSGAAGATVAVARCASYGPGVSAVLGTMFDQLGGIDRLVKGKVVAIKINMSNPLRERTGFRPAWFTRWTHPDVIAAAVQLFGKAGARRIRILESSTEDAHPLEENFLIGGWDPDAILKAAPSVEMENTSGAGSGHDYSRLEVPGGGLIYPGFDVNHSYADCDVMVSMAKLLENRTTGLSLSMENMLGITPVTIYGDAAGYEAPSDDPYGSRNAILATGQRQPPHTSPAEKDPNSPREPGYRLPRITVDLLKARPVHLAIIDGVESQAGGEGPAPPPESQSRIRLVKPGVLIAGFDPVATDAVGAAIMGFDPMADRGRPPFETCDSTLRLAEEASVGTRDLSRVKVAGTPVAKVRVSFRGPS
ncbi:MAG: DUF362 domain-containing protein [Bryobacterales bacterium]|nr:DUF362 domain-containing protein [Bryobacterales bacterium]